MRLSDLLDRDVVDADGQRLGSVVDVRLVQDGPVLSPHGAAFRLSGLIVVERRHLRLFGYERDVGPWLLRAIARRLAGGVWYVGWDQVHELSGITVRLRGRSADVPQLEEIPSRRSPSASH
jgi:PRC-barrel domain